MLDFRGLDHGPEIILLPWPNDRILDGLDHAGFPGWRPRDCSAHRLCGWGAGLDAVKLQMFMDQERKNYKRSMQATQPTATLNAATISKNMFKGRF